MKKLLSVLLCVVMVFGLSAGALAWTHESLPESMNITALQEKFQAGIGPKTEGYAIDYRYFSPVGEDDTTKYPLVVWLHGMWEGGSEGAQIMGNDIAYWASDAFQSRFVNGGAFIFVPRSPEEQLNYWGNDTIYPMRAALDDFIAQHVDNIDISRIYVGGFSMGGKMTLNMTIAYPDMFAAAFPICPAISVNAKTAQTVSHIPYWFVSGKGDPLVNYTTGVTPTWNNIAAANDRPADCRFSTLEKVCYPDGSKASSAHHAWFSVNFDMFSVDNGDYPYMSTVNGLGEEVTLTYPEGMIAWLSQFTSDYDGTPATDSGNLNAGPRSIINLIYEFFAKITEMFKQAFEKMFGAC